MQFVVIGMDGMDDKAPDRRQTVRADHIAMGDELLKSGNLLYGAALLHDDGSMKGSIYIMNFENEAQFEDYKNKEPYIAGDVWRDVTVHKSNTRDPWQFNRDKAWFKERGL
jgi:uncharacterized protein YciI